jgi:hypothetical protein
VYVPDVVRVEIVSSTDTPGRGDRPVIVDDLLCLADRMGGLRIFDISDPMM